MNLLLVVILAASLPTFRDFSRIDRERRTTGQFQTTESLQATRVDPKLIASTVKQHADDPEILWGAAELLADWPVQKSMFESALRAGGTNVAVALRFACAAARHSDFDLAARWVRHCEERDAANTAPWLVELWVEHQQKLPGKLANPAGKPPTEFRDYGADTARTRIHLLEAAGYSPYSARRLGFGPDSALLSMAGDLCRPPVSDAALPLLEGAARVMQRHPTFILTELVGESVERNLLALRKDAATSEKIYARVEEMNARREELRDLISALERNTIDLASEEQMVGYFDNVLTFGEEAAMKQLAIDVRRQLDAP